MNKDAFHQLSALPVASRSATPPWRLGRLSALGCALAFAACSPGTAPSGTGPDAPSGGTTASGGSAAGGDTTVTSGGSGGSPGGSGGSPGGSGGSTPAVDGGTGNAAATGGAGGSTTPVVQDGAYRVSQMALIDPRLWTTTIIDGTADANKQVTDALTKDTSPADGFADLSPVTFFKPLDVGSTAATPVDIVFADCTMPLTSTTCTPSTARPPTASTYTGQLSGSCGQVEPGTTTNSFPINDPPAPCFATAPETLTITFSGMTLKLYYSVIAASYGAGNPPGSLDKGVLKGFLLQSDADTTTVPTSNLIFGGKKLSTLIKTSDQDTGPGGEVGYWMYFNINQDVRVDYTP